jgi:uncharacterized protein YutE (UPF0331/DUF86 family)
MVSPQVVRKRLTVLEGYLRKLRRIRDSTTLEKFLADGDLQDIVERNLEMAIEVVIDLGNHIIASFAWKPPDRYQDVFVALEEHGLISKELGYRISGMAGFRNILAHEYVDINHTRVYEILQNNLDDLVELAKVYDRFAGPSADEENAK